MKQLNCKILENKKIAPGFYKMRVESPYLAAASKPGQFVKVRCSDGNDPLLRRPLGIHRILKSGVEILYEVVGKGTDLLSKKAKGEALDIIGPLGNGFTLPRITNDERRTTILIAGGIGVAPLFALAESLAFSVQRIAYSEKRKIYVFIGAKSKNHILCVSGFKKLGCEIRISTEDGSMGVKGLVTTLLQDFLNAKRYSLNAIYACGPHPMLKAAAHIARLTNAPCQVSLDERMACGVGVCLGCPVKVKTNHESRITNDEYKMVCKDGPVFDAEEIVW